MSVFDHRRWSFVAFIAAALACGGPGATDFAESELSDSRVSIRGALLPQSFVHDTIADDRPRSAWTFHGSMGDVVAPDVWPTPSADQPNTLSPRIALYGPSKSGKRPLLATGSPRSEDERHQAIDGFRLPKTGTYLVVVAQDEKGRQGELTLRFWTSASHAPRPDKAQLELSLRTSEAMRTVLDARAPGGERGSAAWTDEQVDAAVAIFSTQPDLLIAASDARVLLLHLAGHLGDGRATQAQLDRVRTAAAALVGRPWQFATLPPQHQAFALLWLGQLDQPLFEAALVDPSWASAPLRNVRAQIDALQASWPGSREQFRFVRELSLGGVAYGYAVDWLATQDDRDGTPVFLWSSTDWFDKNGRWLGQQSAGAEEPDDG